MVQEAEPERPTAQNKPATWLAAIVVIALVGGVAILTYRLYPAGHREPKNPNFIDNIFANNLVLFAARLVLISAALVLAAASVFIVISFWKRGKAGHWLTRFGPFETQAIEDLRGELETWQGYWAEGREEAESLRERVDAAAALVAELMNQVEEEPEEA